jgi:hypothetical protein
VAQAYLAFKEKGKRIERAVVIEATWEGSTQILNDPKLANLTKVKIEVRTNVTPQTVIGLRVWPLTPSSPVSVCVMCVFCL